MEDTIVKNIVILLTGCSCLSTSGFDNIPKFQSGLTTSTISVFSKQGPEQVYIMQAGRQIDEKTDLVGVL